MVCSKTTAKFSDNLRIAVTDKVSHKIIGQASIYPDLIPIFLVPVPRRLNIRITLPKLNGQSGITLDSEKLTAIKRHTHKNPVSYTKKDMIRAECRIFGHIRKRQRIVSQLFQVHNDKFLEEIQLQI